MKESINARHSSPDYLPEIHLALGSRMSHTRIRIKRDTPGLEVRMSLGEVRSNSEFGSYGIKNFLEFCSGEPDDKLCIIDMETGAIKLEAPTCRKSPKSKHS